MINKWIFFVLPALFCGQLLAASLQFGSGVDKTLLTDLTKVQATPEQFVGKTITVQGKIVSVCQKKGCWMQLAVNSGHTFKIKVRDGDMVFPVSARGKNALATGQLVKIEQDLASSHEQMAAEAKAQGKSFDPATVTKPQISWQLVPTAVEILAE